MPELPAHASVIVVGGGVMGCSTLYHLAKLGISDAIVLERNQLTSGTTWHSAAQVRALRSSRNLTGLIGYSIELYANLEAETGQQTGWINKGSLSIATNPDRLIHIKRQVELAKLFGVNAQTISIDEAKERWPHMNSEDVIGAVWSPDDGRVSPSDLCAALIKGAVSHGAKVFENTGVTGIVTKNGSIHGVETTKGPISCNAIALCTGLWSREAGRMAQLHVPVWSCEHFYLLTKPVRGIQGNLPTLSDHDSHLYIRDDSGGLLIGCFEPMGKPISPSDIGHDFAFGLLDEDWDHFAPMMKNALHRLPALESAEIKMLLNGPESFTPDGTFILGEAQNTRGLFLGCGMNSVGVATSGGAGMALAQLIESGRLPMDLHEADPQRFPAEFSSVEFLTDRVPEVLGRHYEITYPGRQWLSGRNCRKTPLHNRFVNEKAHFGQFFGWERPLYFGKTTEPKLTFGRPEWFDQVADEVRAAHHASALFDQSTFGKIEISGEDSCRFLNRVCCSQIDRPVGRAIYTAMLNDTGGIECDLTIVRIDENLFRLYVGSQYLDKSIGWLQRHRLPTEQVTVEDVSELFGVIALMGPNSGEIAIAAGAKSLTKLKYFECGLSAIDGYEVTAVRLSYVGECGWELTCKAEHVVGIYDALRSLGAMPVGLFAQTSMRIEKRFFAYGHELDCETSPLDAGLAFMIDWNKEFVGKSALERIRHCGCKYQVASIVFDDTDAQPLGDEPVVFENNIIGKTTSAAFGFRIGAPIALAHIQCDPALDSLKKVEINIAGKQYLGRVLSGAAFDPTSSRMKHQ